jgi:prophage regulatory protein
MDLSTATPAGIKRTIRRPEVIRKTGISRTAIYLLERKGEFPQHWMQTPRCAVWDEAEIETWLATRRTAAIAAAGAKNLPWPSAGATA